MRNTRIRCTLTLLLLFPLTTLAQTIRLEGKVDGQYDIVLELTKGTDGYSGRYAYKSTLRDKGDVASSYLYIKADKDNTYGSWVVRDNEGVVKEHWFGINFTDQQSGRQTLVARMKNARGTYCDIEASASGTTASNFPLVSYFRHHLGDYAGEVGVFSDSRVSSRLQKMLGLLNFSAMKEIYQAETSIEYRSGMYWAFGFESHNCCDPVAVWAYDTRSNLFYVWMRRDGTDQWWSEHGDVALDFRELVETQF